MSRAANYSEERRSYQRRPSEQIRFKTSRDGKYIIVQTITSWVFPAKYLASVVAGTQVNAQSFRVGQNSEPPHDQG